MNPHRFMAACALAALPGTLQAQAPTLDVVLGRAAAYVDSFQQQLSGIVAEEDYLQQVVPGERRELKSDLLLVRPAGLDRWLQFRDIFEVNGQPVRDREERLSKLFLQPAPTAMEQARREMIAEHPDVRAQITVSYQSEPVVGLLVPVEMRETYTNKILRSTPARRWVRIEATATYGRFRQFEVHVDQRFEIDR